MLRQQQPGEGGEVATASTKVYNCTLAKTYTAAFFFFKGEEEQKVSNQENNYLNHRIKRNENCSV